jgi:hypothetical protein
MQSLKPDDYLKALKERGGKNRVSQHFQFVGLEIAMILGDLEHKALYIKFAKEYNPEQLLDMAKSIKELRGINNPGAYFMRMVQGLRKK